MEASQEVQTQPKPKKTSVFERAFFVQISKGQPGRSRALPKEFIQVQGGDSSSFHGSKDLYRSDIFKRLDKNEIRLDAELDLLCFPFPLQRGTRIVPYDMFNEVDKKLNNHVKVRKAIISEFKEKVPGSDILVYDRLVLDSQQYLGSAFNPADYPPIEIFLSKFRFEWNVMNMGPDEQLKNLKKEYYEREANKLAQKWEEAGEAAKQLLRSSMAGMVEHLCDRLSTSPDGKRRVFRDTVLAPMNEFIRTFPAMNITDDKELEALVQKTQQLVNGVDPRLLRTDQTLRTSVEEGFSKIKEQLSSMIVKSPSRVIRFDD